MNEDINVGDIEKQLKTAEMGLYNKANSPEKTKVIKVANNDGKQQDVSVKDIAAALQDKDEDELSAIKFLDQGLNKNNTVYKQLQKDKQAAATSISPRTRCGDENRSL